MTAERVEGIDRRGSTEDTIGERSDDFTTIDNRARREPPRGTAILLCDDRVLRDVYEPASQITGIRRFESRVGKTLARPMRRIEVFENGKSLFKIRNNRRFR